ncbi:MAG: SGNH/GDSL hydrolase family protein [Pseudomonadota bacterium]
MSVRSSVSLATIGTALAVAAPAAAVPYSDLIVFGDSIVDAGNIFVATSADPDLPLTPDPALGYFQGRFSEGPTFADLLNARIEGTLSAPSLLGGQNFAFGGARIVDNTGEGFGQDSIPDLDLQVGTYLAGVGGVADADALYTISAAGNDIFAIQSGTTGGLTSEEYIALATQRTIANIVALDQAGATNILLMGVPNTSVAEGIALETSILTALATTELEAEVFNFSYFDFFTTILTDPSALGLPVQDTSVTCLEAREVVDGQIDCTGIFSFDGIHFTAPIQEALAGQVAALVGLVEDVPAPPALALFGLGLAGLAFRRRA